MRRAQWGVACVAVLMSACGPKGPSEVSIVGSVDDVASCDGPSWVFQAETEPGVALSIGDVASAVADEAGLAELRVPVSWKGAADVTVDNGAFVSTARLSAPIAVSHTPSETGWVNECVFLRGSQECTFGVSGGIDVNQALPGSTFTFGSRQTDGESLRGVFDVDSVADWDFSVFDGDEPCAHLGAPISGQMVMHSGEPLTLNGELWFGPEDAMKVLVRTVGDAVLDGPWAAPVTGEATIVLVNPEARQLEHRVTHGEVLRATDIRYVALIGTESQLTRECRTYTNADGETKTGSVHRKDLVVKIIERSTGETVDETRVRGRTPACTREAYDSPLGAHGDPPKERRALRWVERYLPAQ